MSSYFGTGLIITAIAVGCRYDSIDGWLLLGVGMMSYAVIVGMVNYLDGTKTSKKQEREKG